MSRDDVLRVVRRDHPASDFEEVLAILDEYGVESWHRERDRVHLAVLKLAAGDLEELRRQIKLARTDYRDALAEAEFPENLTRRVPTGRSSAAEQAAMDDRDWDQYQRWLVGP